MNGASLLTAPRPQTRLTWTFVAAPIEWLGGFIAFWDEQKLRGTIYISRTDWAVWRDNRSGLAGIADSHFLLNRDKEPVAVFPAFPVRSPINIAAIRRWIERRGAEQRDAAFVIIAHIPQETPGRADLVRALLASA